MPSYQLKECTFINLVLFFINPYRIKKQKYIHILYTPALQAKYKGAYQKASITIETTFAFPIFLFALYLMLIPLNMMSTQRKMQAVAESICKNVCQYAYVRYTLLPLVNTRDEKIPTVTEKEKEEIDDTEIFLSLLESGALSIYAQTEAQNKIKDKSIQGLHTLGTNCMLDEEMVYIKLHYRYYLPFSLFGLQGIEQSVQSSRRAWVGKERVYKESEEESETEEEMVYVGRTSTRYHICSTCHYLYNDIKKNNFSEIDGLRNKYGAKYQACVRCAKEEIKGVVYTMPSGTSYHTSRECSAIIAYVRKVKKSEVEHLGACSYCGGG